MPKSRGDARPQASQRVQHCAGCASMPLAPAPRAGADGAGAARPAPAASPISARATRGAGAAPRALRACVGRQPLAAIAALRHALVAEVALRARAHAAVFRALAAEVRARRRGCGRSLHSDVCRLPSKCRPERRMPVKRAASSSNFESAVPSRLS